MQVNRIRELPQNSKIVATHTDSPDVRKIYDSNARKIHFLAYLISDMFLKVLIWDVETQPNRHPMLGAAESRPDLVSQ